MAALTIAQLREIELNKLIKITGDEQKARNLMNRYYRLCGMDERLLYLENDERTANRRSTQELSEKAQTALDRLNQDFKPYGIKLQYFGYLPTITYIDNTSTAINSYFYQ